MALRKVQVIKKEVIGIVHCMSMARWRGGEGGVRLNRYIKQNKKESLK